MEKAYERMKRLLSLSSASGPTRAYAPGEAGSTLEDGASFSGVDMDTALNNALEQVRGLVGEEEDEDAQEVLAVEEDEPTIEVKSSSPTLVTPSPHHASAESTASTIADKPLPGLPPPTPSPTFDSARAAVTKRSTDDSDVLLDPTNSGAETDNAEVDLPEVSVEDLPTSSSTVAQVEENEPTEADGPAAEAVEATTPDDEAAAEDEMAIVSEYEQDNEGEPEAQDEVERDEAEQKLPASQDEQAAAPSTSTESADQPLPPATPSSSAHAPTSPSTARRQTDSDASSTTGMRPLVLPITTRLRHRGTRDSIIRLRASTMPPARPAAYTAVKAELDKAELEQDALLDVLRKTRSTLSDVRSQRDNLNPELKREKQLTALVKQELFQCGCTAFSLTFVAQHLGRHPERMQEKLSDLVDTRQEWETQHQVQLRSDASPLKNRSPPSHHYDPSVPPSLPFATLDLCGSKMSSDSTQTDKYSEYAVQSFDLLTGVEELARLKRADAAFLSDLTSEIELSPEDLPGCIVVLDVACVKNVVLALVDQISNEDQKLLYHFLTNLL
uniref:FGENESH: predicted gene_5.599 protein n=1 Tax=Rhodotorula toruloides TaxID=5286 RepID=A0A0K3CE34_RHOTO